MRCRNTEVECESGITLALQKRICQKCRSKLLVEHGRNDPGLVQTSDTNNDDVTTVNESYCHPDIIVEGHFTAEKVVGTMFVVFTFGFPYLLEFLTQKRIRVWPVVISKTKICRKCKHKLWVYWMH